MLLLERVMEMSKDEGFWGKGVIRVVRVIYVII